MTDTPFLCDLRTALAKVLPGLDVRLHVDTGEVDTATPYVVLTATAEQELVRGNHTWELGLTLELHANAHETQGKEQCDLFRSLCSELTRPGLAGQLNAEAGSYYLYAFSLQGVVEPLVQDNTIIQTARCRAVIQY